MVRVIENCRETLQKSQTRTRAAVLSQRTLVKRRRVVGKKEKAQGEIPINLQSLQMLFRQNNTTFARHAL